MNQLTNYKHKPSFLLSDNTSLDLSTQTTIKPERKRKIKKLCNECNQKREFLEENHQICRVCYKAKLLYIPNVEFIAEGGFSKIYKATWIDRPRMDIWNNNRHSKDTIVLKKLNNSKDVTSNELNELKIFYEFSLKRKMIKINNKYRNGTYQNQVSKYFGITQDPVTKDIMFIMSYYKSGDLTNYITKDFYNISWNEKLGKLSYIIIGLAGIHSVDIIHRDFHGGNIFFGKKDGAHEAFIGDLGISKSATESTNDNNNENYGIIPYMAPEIFKGQKYTKASDIYSLGMIMWEFMTGRRPFWDRNHDAELIIEICDGLRPPIVTNAPKGYIELMKECWHEDPGKRPVAIDIYHKMPWYGSETRIIKSSDIGPVTTNNPGAVYRSRPLSGMIRSAMHTMSTRSIKSQYITTGVDKRKFDENQIETCFNEDKIIKKIRLNENENNDYITKEFELDIDMNSKQCISDERYTTREIDFDIFTSL
ncbi:kinase-like domain-containing protein [Rhizophagus clarus]|uniref:Kinase-like domain-containing protein n=1 Tax=Rhizophagus clarus TaxID=94130 RepID=A0A8H3QRX7_9GLOM|nr:kinase-like domain-containing protein [Rhizophagus clarus]